MTFAWLNFDISILTKENNKFKKTSAVHIFGTKKNFINPSIIEEW
jgi:hypothetical protein